MVRKQISDALDTNLIVHYIIGDVPSQRMAVAKLLAESNASHHIADLAVAEAVYVFEEHYEQERWVIVANLAKFFSVFDDVLNYNRELFDLVLPYYESHPSLSFNDCMLAFYAELNHAEPLFTFDAKLAKQHPSAKKL